MARKSNRTSRVKQFSSRTKATKVEEWDGDSDEAGHDQPEDFENMVQRLMNHEEHTKWLNSKTSLVYETIRNKSKDLVKIGVSTIDEVNLTSRELHAQETDYEKYHEDHQLTKQRQDKHLKKDAYRQLHACFPSILEDLGRTRAYELDANSELVKNNPSHRQEIVRNFSKSMRSRLEDAKKKEKENADADALIEMVKKILYY